MVRWPRFPVAWIHFLITRNLFYDCLVKVSGCLYPIPGCMDLVKRLTGEGFWWPGFTSWFPGEGSMVFWYSCMVAWIQSLVRWNSFHGCTQKIPGGLT